jgi:cyclase
MLQQDIPSLNRVLGVTRGQLERARKEVLTETEPKVQERMRAAINSRQALVDTLSRLKILPPAVTVDDALTISDPAREVRLLYLGNGHTEGDLVMFLPVERVVFAGDLFFNAGIPNTQDANILDWMKTLEELTRLDADRYVPGHGAVGTKEDVKQFLGYFEELKALVEPAVTRGDTIEQVLEIPIASKYAGYRFQNLFRPNLEKMYRELKARHLADSTKTKPVPGL